MFNYQTTNTTVNLSFSKEFLNSSEVVKFIEILRIKELLSKSQMTEEQALQLDEEIKEQWWQKNQARFLEKIK
jgi:hypothetical protein